MIPQLTIVVLSLCGLALGLHMTTALLALRRARKTPAASGLSNTLPTVSMLRPVSGLTEEDERSLRSTFELDYPDFEVIICAEREQDPAVSYCRVLIGEYPNVAATLLIGRSRVSANPKLDNLEKGWEAARHDWVIMADCNVEMPKDYIQTMLSGWRENCGVVCAPPLGIDAKGFWSHVECAFLNTYQARWQFAADSLNSGFAQGKSMLWNRDYLNSHGGILALSAEIAEDAAATKLVRDSCLRVCLADRPSMQPIGQRSLRQVWHRQLRWAQLRRQSFMTEFVLEPLSTMQMPLVLAILSAHLNGVSVLPAALGIVVVWYGIEAILASGAGWPLAWKSPLAWFCRDMMLPAVWCAAWWSRSYVWNGKEVDISARVHAT